MVRASPAIHGQLQNMMQVTAGTVGVVTQTRDGSAAEGRACGEPNAVCTIASLIGSTVSSSKNSQFAALFTNAT